MTITPFVATSSSPHRGMTQPPLPVREEKRAGELERERSELAFEERERERTLERVIVFFVFVVCSCVDV